MIKLPAFSKELHLLIKNGLRPSNDINLFIGQAAWKKGAAFSISYPNRTMILPPWVSSKEYFWPVKECGVIIFDTGHAEEDYIHEIALSLFAHEASNIYFVSPNHSLTIFKKELPNER